MKLDVPVTEIQRWKPEPGDVLIVRNTEVEIDQQQADEIKTMVCRALGIEDRAKVAVFGRDWEITVGKVPE